MMESERIPPAILFRSFLLVVGTYVGVFALMVVWLSLIAWFFFPDTIGLLTKQLSEQEYVAQLKTAMPAALFWSATAINVPVCFLAGLFVGRFAQFAPLGHGVFAALLVCVSYLQAAVGLPPEMKWMPFVGLVGMVRKRYEGEYLPILKL